MYNIIYEEKDDFHKVIISEHENDCLFLHCYVLDKPSKKSIVDARKHLDQIKSFLPSLGYKQLFALTPSIKFVEMISKDHRLLKQLEVEGVNMELIVWDLK